jgi:hypothetical protein
VEAAAPDLSLSISACSVELGSGQQLSSRLPAWLAIERAMCLCLAASRSFCLQGLRACASMQQRGLWFTFTACRICKSELLHRDAMLQHANRLLCVEQVEVGLGSPRNLANLSALCGTTIHVRLLPPLRVCHQSSAAWDRWVFLLLQHALQLRDMRTTNFTHISRL